MKPIEITAAGRNRDLAELRLPLELEELAPGGAWEVEIGFGKGRYLIGRAVEEPERRFLGIEMSRPYYRLAARRAAQRSAVNLVLVRGEALYVISALLPSGFARAVHVYFPDPWPKARHHRRRLFDPETVDLVLGLLESGGQLFFATDFIDYGRLVEEILRSHPATHVERLAGGWPEGPRTNYEVKYEREAREILRLRVSWHPELTDSELHPRGVSGIVAATGWRIEDDPTTA